MRERFTHRRALRLLGRVMVVLAACLALAGCPGDSGGGGSGYNVSASQSGR